MTSTERASGSSAAPRTGSQSRAPSRAPSFSMWNKPGAWASLSRSRPTAGSRFTCSSTGSNHPSRPSQHLTLQGSADMKLTSLAAAIVITAAGAGLAAQTVQINGAGATFPYPIYSKWFAEYNKLHSDVRINYQSIGSGGGVRQLSNRTVFFGASDYPLTDEQQLAAPGKIFHFPTVIGAV